MNRLTLCAFLAASLSGLCHAAADKPQVFDIPRMERIVIDGKADDWGEGGFRVEMMNHRNLAGVTTENFDPRYRLGWDERGLLVLLNVRDDVLLEKPRAQDLWQWDNVAITLARATGGKQQAGPVVIGPNADPANPGMKVHFDSRDTTAPAIEARSVAGRGGYVMEVLVPWKALDRVPERGDRMKVTVAVSDIDDEKLNMWFAGLAGNDAREVRLALKPSPPVIAFATGSYERLKETRVSVFATGELGGEKGAGVRRREADRRGGASRATRGARRPRSLWRCRRSAARGGRSPRRYAGQAPIAVPIADAGNRARAAPCGRGDRVRAGVCLHREAFPTADFEHPFLVESLIGPYTVKMTFYDKEYNIVTTASQPGRYGAVVEITPEKGRVTRRLRTVMRLPDAQGRDTALSGTLAFPGDTGLTLRTTLRRKARWAARCGGRWSSPTQQAVRRAAVGGGARASGRSVVRYLAATIRGAPTASGG